MEKEDEEEDKEVENNDKISNKNNEKITGLNKNRQSDVAVKNQKLLLMAILLKKEKGQNSSGKK